MHTLNLKFNKLKTHASGSDLLVELPKNAIDAIDTVIKLEVKGELNVESNMPK